MATTTLHPPHIVLFPSPGMGHLNPLAEFAKRLVFDYNFTATFILFSDYTTQAQNDFIQSLPSTKFSSVLIPSIPLDDLPADTQVVAQLGVMMSRSIPHLRSILQQLKDSNHGVSAFIPDLFAGDTISVARELNIPVYLCFTTTLMCLSLMIHLPALHESTTCEYRDLPEPVKLPGCIPLKGEDLLYPIQDRKDEAYKVMLNVSETIKKVDGIVVNTFIEVEPEAYKALKEMEKEKLSPPLHTVGPLVKSDRWGGGSDECLKWLDSQPDGSVIYVSFGSGWTIPLAQFTELAYGLEASKQRFLWVVRLPMDGENAAYFDLKGKERDVLSCLPDGFLERTKNVGMVVKNWAPQVEVLRHRAIGGFVTHCGWNSTLESLLAGVPLIAWPLYAEQRMNAVMLAEEARVALRLEVGEEGMYEWEEISRVVKELMEGEEGKKVREKMRKLMVSGVRALEEGGDSYEGIEEFAKKIGGSDEVLSCLNFG